MRGGYVDDLVRMEPRFFENPDNSGIFNIGTGHGGTFNQALIAEIAWRGRGEIEYIAFPAALKRRYRSFTEADIGALRQCGNPGEFSTVEVGVRAYQYPLESGRS